MQLEPLRKFGQRFSLFYCLQGDLGFEVGLEIAALAFLHFRTFFRWEITPYPLTCSPVCWGSTHLPKNVEDKLPDHSIHVARHLYRAPQIGSELAEELCHQVSTRRARLATPNPEITHPLGLT